MAGYSPSPARSEDTKGVKHGLDGGAIGDGGAATSPATPIEEEVERPSKNAKEISHKAPRIAKVQAFEHNDIYIDPAFDEEEASFIYEHLEDCDPPDEADYAFPSSAELPHTLFYEVHIDGTEPSLGSVELSGLNGVADMIEMQRLEAMGILSPIEPGDIAASDRLLSTKHVRTWRFKSTPQGPRFLRRSHFMAREFAFIDPGRDHLFSPAS